VSDRRELAPIVFRVLGGLLLAFLMVPLVYLIFRIGWQEIVSSFANPKTIRAVEVSLLTSLISVSVMTLFGVPLGCLLARRGFKGRQLLISLVFVPMALPPLVGGILLLLVYGPYGLVGAQFEKHGLELVNTLAGIVLAQIFVAAPYVVIASISAFGRVDERLEKASAVLGANRWRTFRQVSLPLAWPGILAGIMLAWVRTLGEFGATLIMAYHPNTIPVFLWVQLTSEGLTAALPLALFLVVLALVAVCAVYFVGQFTSVDPPQRRA
jgi:molybdate/tungstate transport system permease protein